MAHDPLWADTSAETTRCGCCHMVKPIDDYEQYTHRCGRVCRYKNCRACRERNAAKRAIAREQPPMPHPVLRDWLADAAPNYKHWVTRAWV